MSDDPVIMPPPGDPMAVARALMEASGRHGRFRHWRGGWWTWAGACWAEWEDAEVRAWLYHELERATFTIKDGDPKPWHPTRPKIANLMEALAALTHLPDTTDPPAWLRSNGKTPPPAEVISTASGLLHITTRDTRRHSPAFFNLVAVPFGYDADAPPPERWLKFLRELWPDDQESITALQQWFGYVLSGRTDLHKVLLMVGPVRSGKGTIARVLAALLGPANVAGPTLAGLAGQFGQSALIGKPLAIISDARLSGMDRRTVVERLLTVSGADRTTVDRKYRATWTGTLPTRLMIMSNELPAFGDASGAIASRMVTLVLTESWLRREDTTLDATLAGELPGILNWALDGLRDLAREGRLTEPESAADAIAALADLVSPVSAFVREECERGGEIEAARLYGHYQWWCGVNGLRPTWSQGFGKELRAVVPRLRMAQPRIEGRQVRTYVGLALNEEAKARAAQRVTRAGAGEDPGVSPGQQG